jgi:hypothetical protein
VKRIRRKKRSPFSAEKKLFNRRLLATSDYFILHT